MITSKCTIRSTYTAPKEKGEMVTACGNSVTIAGRKEEKKYLANDSERKV